MAGAEVVSKLLSTSDGERVNWINQIVGHVWPFLATLAREAVKREIQPLLNEALSPVFDSFTFITIDFGDTPPTIEDVKVYTNPEKPDEISVDFKISFESDCNFDVDVLVASLGIEDFSLKGTVRLLIKPLMDRIPVFGGISISFLNTPEINFKLTGLANILKEVKNSLILSRVCKVVADMAVLPHRVSIPLTPGLDLKLLNFLEPQGVLRLKLLSASIVKSDDIIGKGDPYTIVTVGAQSFKTKAISGSHNPNWNEEFEFIVDEKNGQAVTLRVMDADTFDSDDDIGCASLEICDVIGQFSMDKTLELLLNGKNNGGIHVQTLFYRLSDDPKDLGSSAVGPGNPQAVLVVYVGSVLLPKPAQQKTSYITRLSVAGTSQDTRHVEGSTTLAWNQTLRFLVLNPKEDSLSIQILEKDQQKVVGETSLSLMYLPKADSMEMDSELPLAGGNGFVRVAVMLRALTSV